LRVCSLESFLQVGSRSRDREGRAWNLCSQGRNKTIQSPLPSSAVLAYTDAPKVCFIGVKLFDQFTAVRHRRQGPVGHTAFDYDSSRNSENFLLSRENNSHMESPLMPPRMAVVKVWERQQRSANDAAVNRSAPNERFESHDLDVDLIIGPDESES
jgi:hypothetical protein